MIHICTLRAILKSALTFCDDFFALTEMRLRSLCMRDIFKFSEFLELRKRDVNPFARDGGLYQMSKSCEEETDRKKSGGERII